MSHSAKEHLCADCQCRLVAGTGTKGDFYGLGPRTGHIGVGFCYRCESHLRLRPGINLKHCRQQVETLQIYGTATMSDDEYGLRVMKEEAALAAQATEEREELKLVRQELSRFLKMLEEKDTDKQPTEISSGKVVPMSDKTRITLMTDIANTLSRLGINSLKMDQDNYVHVDELTKRMPEMMVLVFNCMSKLEEMLMAKYVRGEELDTHKTPQDYCRQMCRAGMQTIWQSAKTGRCK